MKVGQSHSEGICIHCTRPWDGASGGERRVPHGYTHEGFELVDTGRTWLYAIDYARNVRLRCCPRNAGSHERRDALNRVVDGWLAAHSDR